MHHTGRGRKRKRKNNTPEGYDEELDDLVRKARRLMKETNDEIPKKAKRAESTVWFSKDSVTGRRITHSKYRPVSARKAGHRAVEEDAEADDDAIAGSFI